MITTVVAIYARAKYDTKVSLFGPVLLDVFVWASIAHIIIEGGFV